MKKGKIDKFFWNNDTPVVKKLDNSLVEKESKRLHNNGYTASQIVTIIEDNYATSLTEEQKETIKKDYPD